MSFARVLAGSHPSPLVSLTGVTLGYAGRTILASVDLVIHEGERVALLGRSGSGKSTLLNALFDGLADRAALIPQAAALVPQLSAFHNVYMGRLDRHSTVRNLRELLWPARATLAEVTATLARVDLADAVRQKAGTLSGGQQQRVSVARALYNGRPIVLGDEPVSALDARQGARVLETIHAVHATSILALHDVALALDHASRVVVLKDGRVALDAPATGLRAADLVALYQA
jgi:phosphonate transport system ATP-binding protein